MLKEVPKVLRRKRFLIVVDNGTGVLINDNFTTWNNIKNEHDSINWKKTVLEFKAGTYNQFDLLDMIIKLKDEDIQKTYLENNYIKEIKKVLKTLKE